MKILIPTDFSKCANNAIQYGLEIAAKTGATVTLLHVLYPFESLDNNIYKALWIDDYVKLRKEEMKKVATAFLRKPEFSKIEISEKVEIGFPVPQICEIADEMKADLLVIGSTGASDLSNLFLGSNASGLLAKTRIPVLTVPMKATFQPTTTAVFPTDFNMKINGESLSVLKNVLAAHSASLTVLHILSQPGEQPHIAGEGNISQKLAGIAHHFKYLHDTDVPQAVHNYMESVDANLLVSISHDHALLHRLFYESVSKELAYRVRIPMLVLHDAKS